MTVSDLAADRGISRLCHLTPLRNLVHLADGAGLLSIRQLAQAGGDFTQQDLDRIDNHPDHISCSIEYPNAWYLRQRRLKARSIELLFPDWVCLALDPIHLGRAGTRLCVRNAAAAGGSLVRDVSPEAFDELYHSPILGAGGVERRRTQGRILACPTDDQAEVLVHRSVPLDDLRTVIVRSEENATRFHAALRQIGAEIAADWTVAPTLFSADELSAAIACGERPIETPWEAT